MLAKGIQQVGFAMEFHLPYFALRKNASPISDLRGLRRSADFLRTLKIANGYEQIHEAQISVLVAGIDEWYWTVHCCVNNYFGSKEMIQYYVEKKLDGPIGEGGRSKDFPVWNPREYFLMALSRRIRQVTWEWSSVVLTLEECFKSHVSSIIVESQRILSALQDVSIFDEGALADTFVDDNKFTRTKEYTRIVQLLRLLHNSLVKLLDSWGSFQSGEIRYFRAAEDKNLDRRWKFHIASIEENVTELRFLRRSLQQRIEMFDSMRNGVSNKRAIHSKGLR